MKKTALYISTIALGMMSLVSCNEDPVLPPVPVPPVIGGIESIGDGSYEKPISCWQAEQGFTDPEGLAVWCTGYIVGWIDTDANPTHTLDGRSARYTVPAGSESNMLMSYKLPYEVEMNEDGSYKLDEDGLPIFKLNEDGEKILIADENFWEDCITVQLPSGNVRNELNLTRNPGNLCRQVTIKGTSGSKYCGAYGIRDTSAFNWGPQGVYEEPQEPVPPMPGIVEGVTFTKVEQFEGPGQYILVFNDNKMAGPVEPSNYSYGYLPAKDVTVTDNQIVTSTLNAYMFYEVEGGYEIRDGYGRYVWWDSDPSHKSFQLTPARGTEGDIWSVTAQSNGTFEIKNVEMGVSMQYSTQYNNVSAYSNNSGVLPTLFKRNN
ncbi:MAG: hypothetical protein K2N03_08100 [Muribaculaceae bacterium]|nr:hypothetical protein [Muribaculaceae bacterium]